MNNMLLKFGEEVIAKSAPPETTRSIDPGILQQRDQDALESIQSSMDAQFTALASMIERLNGTMSKIVSLLEKQSESKDKGIVVSMDQTIPNLQQYSQPQDLRTIRVEHTASAVVLPPVIVPAAVVAPTAASLPTFNDEEEEVEEEVEVEVEEEEVEVEEEEVEVEVEEEEEAVEEWTYKGRSYFKSTDHKVYAVDSDGDPGELLGIYDPVKNLVRKA